MRLSPKMRKAAYYTVEAAGRMEPIGWSRTESYRAVERGDIPAKRHGKFLLVPRGIWDAKLQRLRQELREAGQRRRPKRQATKTVARKVAAKQVATADA
jgi:hypothetical protein